MFCSHCCLVVMISFATGADPKAANNFRKTSLMYACDYREVEVAALLLEHGEQLALRHVFVNEHKWEILRDMYIVYTMYIDFAMFICLTIILYVQ